MTTITGTIADSAGAPANGRIEFAQTSRIDTGTTLITGTIATAQVTNGEIRSTTGTPLTLPPNPEGTAIRVREILGGRTYEWWTAIPNTDEIEYRQLPIVESTDLPVSHFAPPPWIAQIEQARDEALAAVDAVDEAVTTAVADLELVQSKTLTAGNLDWVGGS